MKRTQTDRLLILGMAMTTDKHAMERRVRGVFARRRSARSVLALALTLVLALAVGAFTTACQPGETLATSGNTQLSSAGDAAPSATASDAQADAYTKKQAMEWLSIELEMAREFPAPRMNGICYEERGSWSVEPNPDESAIPAAKEAFLSVANELFFTAYTPDDLTATYYLDESGYREDVWRFDSTDGVLSGTVSADTLAFISADSLNEPSDQPHESLVGGNAVIDEQGFYSGLDTNAAVERIAQVLGTTAGDAQERGGSLRQGEPTGWSIQKEVLFALDDGRYCTMCVFGDEKLTPITVCVHPDEECAEEGVFWRADLERSESAVTLKDPQDFRKGEPGADDMSAEQAYEFYYKLVNAAGHANIGTEMKEPNSTFYVDYSGARENYWHIEGEFVTFDLTSRTQRVLNLKSDVNIGFDMGLISIPYEQMGEQEYMDATQSFFEAVFGADQITDVFPNAVYDGHYCTMDVNMADGSMYEIMYEDGLITEMTNYLYVERDSWKIVPSWLADWTYLNTETGEVFVQEW